MPLEPEDQYFLTAAEGFVELGMYLDANDELELITPELRHLPEVLEVRLQIYESLEKWELMQVVASRLAKYDPDEVKWAVDWAYSTRRAESLEASQAHPSACPGAASTGGSSSLQSRLLRVPAREPGSGQRGAGAGLQTRQGVETASAGRSGPGTALGFVVVTSVPYKWLQVQALQMAETSRQSSPSANRCAASFLALILGFIYVQVVSRSSHSGLDGTIAAIIAGAVGIRAFLSCPAEPRFEKYLALLFTALHVWLAADTIMRFLCFGR